MKEGNHNHQHTTQMVNVSYKLTKDHVGLVQAVHVGGVKGPREEGLQGTTRGSSGVGGTGTAAVAWVVGAKVLDQGRTRGSPLWLGLVVPLAIERYDRKRRSDQGQ